MSGTEERQAGALADISRGLARLHTEYYGNGPTKGRAYMVDDTVACFLEGGFTTVEQTLIADGKSEAVRRIRRSIQSAMEEPFCGVVEDALGRKVLAYMSQIHTSPDLAVDLFVLAPSGEADAGGREPGSARGEVLARISTGLVQLHSRYYGKGPTRAKTFLVDDTVISILGGGFTTVERTLIDEGNVEAVYEIRRSFQHAMEDHITAVVEEALGRKAIAYLSQVHHDPDLAVEMFMLEPSEESAVAEHQAELSDRHPSGR